MSRVYDCRDEAQRTDGVAAAAAAIARGQLVVLPTDTVYGIAADAFDPVAVAGLLAAKGRGRDAPPPVLVAGPDVLPALTSDVTDEVTALTERFWPGGLTVICWAQASLSWDLGDTGGTVAIRVPDHELALQLLRATGPLAVSSANLTGRPPGATAEQTRDQLGDAVPVYLEDGELAGGTPSSIVDATGEAPVLVRAGAVTLEQLREVVPDLVDGTGATATEVDQGARRGSRATPGAEPDQGPEKPPSGRRARRAAHRADETEAEDYPAGTGADVDAPSDRADDDLGESDLGQSDLPASRHPSVRPEGRPGTPTKG